MLRSPLPEAMIHYARQDTHYLLYIYDRMRQELVAREELSRGPNPLIVPAPVTSGSASTSASNAESEGSVRPGEYMMETLRRSAQVRVPSAMYCDMVSLFSKTVIMARR